VKTLYSFCAQSNCADGEAPYGALIQATDGNLYGTTDEGGDLICPFYTTCGTVYKMTPSGELTTLYSFCAEQECIDGQLPRAGLVQATNGNLYGTTLQGGQPYCNGYGCGTIFEISPQGTFTSIHSFNYLYDGAGPTSELVQGSDGNLYGTAYTGGQGNGDGTIFKMSLTGSVTLLHVFDYADGSEIYSDLFEASDGNFYGTAVFGGAHDLGTLFSISPTGTFTTLHSFNGTDGAQPYRGVIQATDGNFYGMTSVGGAYQDGTIFEITPGGVLTTLHSFDGTDGAVPNGGLIQATDGNFYGATAVMTNGACCGTIFKLSVGLGPFVTFVRAAGKVGQTGGILGQGFTGTTSIAINGIPASFTVKSDTFIEATVPTGATTGYVTVTTPSGTLTSNVPFHVIP
jgi:uncharacterized repeat protein (TIGR03803 family)